MDEVGGPTILATFTVIAALLPMAFVTGLMGPYMRPIPINASHRHADFAGRGLHVHALAVPPAVHDTQQPRTRVRTAAEAALQRFVARVMTPFLRGDEGRRHRWRLLRSCWR